MYTKIFLYNIVHRKKNSNTLATPTFYNEVTDVVALPLQTDSLEVGESYSACI